MKIKRQKVKGETETVDTKIYRGTQSTDRQDRSRVDGWALLFQANFKGSNQSTAPDTDRATAICLEISPLIGPTEKGHRQRSATCSWLLNLPTYPAVQAASPANQLRQWQIVAHNKAHRFNNSWFYLMMFEQRVSVLNSKNFNQPVSLMELG